MDTGGYDDYFISVAGSGPSDVYALCSRGFILHYDGSTWEPAPSPIASSQARLWMSGPKDLFGFSYNFVYHFDGASWVAFPYMTNTSLNNIAGSGPSNAFAVGNYSTILRYGPQ
jgi:hypothetical protein